MRLTLNIDGDLLDRVKAFTKKKTKTETIAFALEELDRQRRLQEILKEGLGLTPDELENMFDPASIADHLQVAEPSAPYGKKA